MFSGLDDGVIRFARQSVLGFSQLILDSLFYGGYIKLVRRALGGAASVLWQLPLFQIDNFAILIKKRRHPLLFAALL